MAYYCSCTVCVRVMTHERVISLCDQIQSVSQLQLCSQHYGTGMTAYW